MENRKNAEELRVIAEGIRLVRFRSLRASGPAISAARCRLLKCGCFIRQRASLRSPEPEMGGAGQACAVEGHAGPALYATLSLKGFFPKEMLSGSIRAAGICPATPTGTRRRASI
jgi:transketolase